MHAAHLDPRDVWALYWPMRGELSLVELLRWRWRRGYASLLPRITDGHMEMAVAEPGGTLSVGPFGCVQPGPDAQVLMPQHMFVPGVVFDREGGRIGQGGGFYDRWLARSRPASVIGVGFGCQLSDASLLLAEHDMRMDGLLTEAGVMCCKKHDGI